MSRDTTTYNASQPMIGEFGPWFPQMMHLHPSGALLLSYQTDADTLNEAGWMGQHYSSIDGGHSWYPVAMTLSTLHVKPCVAQTDGSLLCMEYAMRKTEPPPDELMMDAPMGPIQHDGSKCRVLSDP